MRGIVSAESGSSGLDSKVLYYAVYREVCISFHPDTYSIQKTFAIYLVGGASGGLGRHGQQTSESKAHGEGRTDVPARWAEKRPGGARSTRESGYIVRRTVY